MPFNLEDYEPVALRLDRWLTAHPNGRVITELVHYLSDVAVFKAELWLDDVLIATGWAEEVRGQGNVNKTSHVENCETGAVGRALANAGMAGSDVHKRPSREEMGKVQRMTQSTTAGSDVVTERPANAPSDQQLWLVKKLHKDLQEENARLHQAIANLCNEMVVLESERDELQRKLDKFGI
jgi:hypothetical protein